MVMLESSLRVLASEQDVRTLYIIFWDRLTKQQKKKGLWSVCGLSSESVLQKD